MPSQSFVLLTLAINLCAAPMLGAKEPGLLFAHRGGAHEFEENTLQAFQQSYEQGLRGFETDVRMTQDGELVILHDDSLDRTYNGAGPVERLTADELRRLTSRKTGAPLLFLDDLLDFFADKPGVYLEMEMKTRDQQLYPDERLPGYCRKLYETIQSRKPEGSSYIFTSFDPRPLKVVKKLDPQADLLLITSGTCSSADVEQAQEIGVKRIGVRIDKVTRSEVAAAQRTGLRVSCWPGHNLNDYHLAVGLGVDAICCDVPVAVQKWKNQHERKNETEMESAASSRE